MAVFTAEMRELTRQLIQTVTGFQPGEENFRLCFQFAKSNFRFHRYLDVNDLKVSRSVKGLCEKFAVHSQPEKSEALQRLTEEFLGYSLERSYPKSDAHYGSLLLLLCLSDSPLHSDYIPPDRPEAPHELGDSFDWASCLMEGIEFPTYSDDESEEWSEDSKEESEDWTIVKPSKSDLNDSAVGEELSDEGVHEEEALDDKLWLQQHLVLPYWDRSNPDYAPLKTLPSSTSAHPACNLATNWNVYSQQLEPFHYPPDPVALSESQVVRETLWVLLGAEKSFVYTFEGEDIGVRRDVQVSHLTPLSLCRQLEYFAAIATHLYRMRQFIQAIGNASMGVPCRKPNIYTSCQTHEAFADALTHCLEGVSVQLQQVEKSIVDREKFVSLMSLEIELRPALMEVEGLYSVFSRGILPSHSQADSPPAAHVCSAHLLDTLWDALQFYDTMGTPGVAMVKMLLPLWVMTARPYMGMLAGWMVQGAAADRWEEFPIQRNPAVAAKSPDYWSRCFRLRDGVPLFLRPAMEKVFLAGKSMHLIESIGKLKQVEQEEVGPTPPNLYDEFLQSLRTELVRTKSPPLESRHESEESGFSSNSSKDAGTFEGPPPAVAAAAIAEGSRDGQAGADIDSWEKVALWNVDPLLEYFFTTLHVSPPEEADFNPSKILWKDLRSLAEDLSLLMPVTTLIQNCCLYPLIHKRYTKACGALIRLLRSEYCLTEHFRTVRLFLLMEAGDTMLHFYTDVFQRIQEGGVWWEPSYLNSLLQEVLQGHYPSAEKSLSVQVGDSPYRRVSIYSIGTLSLCYDVPWPLDTIFSPPLMRTYNEVFRFLLQVKWAKWSLDEIRTRACTVVPLPQDLAFRLHQLLLLRAKLVLFTNNLNNYLMTRILHSVGLEFQANVAQAEDLDSIIALHREYVSTIFDRCLLNKKAAYVKEAIMKILSLALSFRQRWEEGVSKFSFAEAERIETEFSKCSHFLITCLNNTIKRGSFPHLETLAFSLRSLKSTQKIFSSRKR